MRLIRPDKLTTREPFNALFPIQPHVLAAIKERMEADGLYDESKPIDVWEQGDSLIVVDGHTRLQAAKDAGLDAVAIFEHAFADEDEALEYAIRNQRDRRNLTDADLLRLVAVVDARQKRGGDRGNQYTGGKASRDALPKSSAQTAATLGVSQPKVERARTVIDHADEGTKQAVLTGEKSINAAYNETRQQRREAAEAGVERQKSEPAPQPVELTIYAQTPEDLPKPTPKPATKPTFNYQTSDGIEWAKWSWNPVTGCLHDCGYCYAREIANRYYPEKFKPTYHPERLSAPHNTKQKPSAVTDIGERNVFVGSMADLFGHWVPQEWIDAVLEECRKAPQWNFLFLTKNPKRYVGIDWPANAWVGTTVDEQKRVLVAERAFAKFQAPVKFLSCEPLLEPLTFTSLEMFDWIIIGGQSANSQVREFQPPWEWVESLLMQARAAGCKVYLKPNLKTRPKEYPIGALRDPVAPDPDAAADLAKELGDDGDGA